MYPILLTLGLLVMYCCKETILICQSCDEIKYHIMYSTHNYLVAVMIETRWLNHTSVD